MTRLWHVCKIIGGKQNYTLLDLHEKHGHFVRVAHNEVSVCHPDAVKTLYLSPTRKVSALAQRSLPALPVRA